MAILVGVALHIVLSGAFGIIIVVVANKVTHAYIATGLLGGAALWLINYVALPAIYPGARAVPKVNAVPVAVGLHLLFGLIAAVVAVVLERS